MNDAITWFEIPTRNLDEQTRFYEAMLGKSLKREVFGGSPMSIFLAEQGVGGALVLEAKREPGAGGTIVYLDVTDLDACVARAASAGGAILLPKTDIGENGTIARVKDPEGNVVGLNERR